MSINNKLFNSKDLLNIRTCAFTVNEQMGYKIINDE